MTTYNTSIIDQEEPALYRDLAHTNGICSHAGINTHLTERPEREAILEGEHIPDGLSTNNDGASAV